jgi:hypothetical protein
MSHHLLVYRTLLELIERVNIGLDIDEEERDERDDDDEEEEESEDYSNYSPFSPPLPMLMRSHRSSDNRPVTDKKRWGCSSLHLPSALIMA